MFSDNRPVRSINLFYIYTREDSRYAERLRTYMSSLIRRGLITQQYERVIVPGAEWSEETDHLDAADIVVILVSADLVASDFLYGDEMAHALQRHKQEQARVIPIIIRPVDWEGTLLKELQALPRDGRPVTQWSNRDEAYLDIVKGIRLVCEELQGIVPDEPRVTEPTVAQEFFELHEVFKRSGVPTVTFVEPDEFPRLKSALKQRGLGVVIEGPSGIGKTTALKRAISQLHASDQIPDVKMLSARRAEDGQRLTTIQQWHNGIVVLDDFHRLETRLRQDITDYLKYLADNEFEDRKLVIVGIPQTGKRLVELFFDVATRIEICKLGRVEDDTVLRLIEKGERALNIALSRKTDIARAAAGSLNIAQFLCYEIGLQEGITQTQSVTKEISTDLEEAVSQVMDRMSLKFGDVIRFFASLGGVQDRTSIELLRELARTDDGVLALYPLVNTRPELTEGVDHFLSSNLMDTLYGTFPVSKNHILLDQITPALVVDDPQLFFYLAHTPVNDLIIGTRKRKEVIRSKIFVSYSHDDERWLKRLRVHLKPLERMANIETWDDTQIEPGSMWRREIEQALDSAKVALLLVSANFLASDFVVENELPPLLAAAAEEGTVILPVIVGYSLFGDTELAQFQAVNAPTQPLDSLPTAEQEEVFVRVAQAIKGAFLAS
jgi:hypothetical protein